MEKDFDVPKRVVKTPWNRPVLADDYEFNIGSSLTEPDQSYTIREILERFSRGGAPAVDRGLGEYAIRTRMEDDLTDSDFFTSPFEEPGLDLADLDDIRGFAEEKMSSAKSKYLKDKQNYAESKREQDSNSERA